MIAFWLWLGFVGMASGAVLFGRAAYKAKTEQWQILLTLHFFICLISTALYLAMILGQGFINAYDRPIYWVRYLTWGLSTPLILLVITRLGGSSLLLTASLIGADLFMIATGYVAAVSPVPINFIWYLVSCGAFVALFYLLLRPYRVQAVQQHPRAKKAIDQLLSVQLVLWTLYPIVWLLGKTGFNLFNPNLETLSYTLLDLAAKVGFGFFALATLRKQERLQEMPQRLEQVLR